MADKLLAKWTFRRLLGALIRLIGGAVIRWVYRIRTVHPEHVPQTGGVLLLPNHVTFADGFFITAASPRPVRFVMDESFVAHLAVRIFTQIFETVTIRQDQPREAIRITIDALKNGDLVCLFPEGQLTRTGTLCELRRGFELIAKKAGHPMIPLWLDGSWGSLFSFERGRFFKKLPRHFPTSLTAAFGVAIPPAAADLATVREGLLRASAAALAARFAGPRWAGRREIWANGYQIGQVNALQRRVPFCVLAADPLPPEMPGLMLAFPALFKAEVRVCYTLAGLSPMAWVGGDSLRQVLETTPWTGQIQFYDFGPAALQSLDLPGLRHYPCLAVDGVIIAMSMPNPVNPFAAGLPQAGHKPQTWGKLLPGWFLVSTAEGGLRAHGPAAPEEGLALPLGAHLDAEGFLTRGGDPVIYP